MGKSKGTDDPVVGMVLVGKGRIVVVTQDGSVVVVGTGQSSAAIALPLAGRVGYVGTESPVVVGGRTVGPVGNVDVGGGVDVLGLVVTAVDEGTSQIVLVVVPNSAVVVLRTVVDVDSGSALVVVAPQPLANSIA